MKMTKKQDRLIRLMDNLRALGFSLEDAHKLRRIEMTLQRWGELECGDSNDYCSFGIERDEETGKPFMVTRPHNENKARRYAVADREKGALKRLAVIMSSHPDLIAYHQGDPRGCALYILRKSDLRAGESVDSVYSRGLAVCE